MPAGILFLNRKRFSMHANYQFIRQVDSFGRVVLPSEFRHNLHIKENDPLEIKRMGCGIYMEKYQPLQTLDTLCEQYLSVMAKNCGVVCAILGTDFVIASKGIHFSTELPLSKEVKTKIRSLKSYQYTEEEKLYLFSDGSYLIDTLYPIGTKEKPKGAVMLLHYRNTTAGEKICAKMTAELLTELTNHY